jgi:hypothetical protein
MKKKPELKEYQLTTILCFIHLMDSWGIDEDILFSKKLVKKVVKEHNPHMMRFIEKHMTGIGEILGEFGVEPSNIIELPVPNPDAE